VNKNATEGSTGGKGNSTESKKRIQQAALEVFSEHGFKGATTREIAQRAGLNLALIKRYFGGKEGLYDAVVGAYAHEMLVDLDYPPRETLEEELRSCVRAHMERFSRDIRFIRVTLAGALMDPARCEQLRRHLPRKGGHPTLLRRLEELKARGRIAADVDVSAISEGMATYIMGQVMGGLIISELSPQELGDQVERFLKYFSRP
jgi:AcrR family transcriptional regulator